MFSWESQFNFEPQYTVTEQVMHGHNVVADWWAGAANPHPHPTPPQPPFQHRHVHKKLLKHLFLTLARGPTDRRINRLTDQWTDKQSLSWICVSGTKKPSIFTIAYIVR